MKTSVVICTYNRLLQLKRGLYTLMNQSVKPDEIIIVDDGSSDGTGEWVKSIESDIPINYIFLPLNHPTPRISCIPRNVGIKAAKHEIIIFTESEALHVGDTIKQILHKMVKFPNDIILASHVYIFGEKLYKDLSVGGKFLYSNESFKNPLSLMEHPYCQEVSGFFSNTKAPDSDWALSGEMKCHAGVLFGLPKQWLLDVGGFDESFEGQGFDDFDLFGRLRLYRKELNQCSDIRVIHQWHDKSFYKFDIFKAAEKNGLISHNNIQKGIYKVNEGKEWGK